MREVATKGESGKEGLIQMNVKKLKVKPHFKATLYFILAI